MASPEQPTQAARDTRAQLPILLVDDQRFVGLALGRLLDGDPRFALHCCERGSEAEATADHVTPALILQDLVLPDADGLTLVRRFRDRPATAQTPVIVLSGNDDPATRAAALAAGAVDYLVKLPTKDALLACFERHLGMHTNAAAVARGGHRDAGEVFDTAFLAAYRDADAADPDATLRELLDVFVRDAERLTEDVRRASAAGFSAAVPRLAHALKGCAMAAGARPLAALCAQLETGTLDHADGVARLDVELARVKAAAAELMRQRCGI
jgi:DNA-binding response OmpR family regulator